MTFGMTSDRLVGVALVVVSAASFGTAGVLARVAYDDGAEPIALLACRFAIAASLFAVARLARPAPAPRGRALRGLAVMGVAYFLQSFCYFTAVDHAPPGLVALLLYTFPAIVVVLGAVVLHLPLRRRVAVACGVALAGTALIVVPTVGGGDDASPLGIALALGAALVYSGYILLGSKVLERVDPLWASTVIMATAAAGYAVTFAVTRPALPDGGDGWAAIVAVAVVCTVVAGFTFLAGLLRIGPADASTVSTLEPVVSVVLSAVVVGEAVTGWTIAGGLLVLGAVLAISRSTG
jgi:drug/metabolite transporter (DMT)-like permease